MNKKVLSSGQLNKYFFVIITIFLIIVIWYLWSSPDPNLRPILLFLIIPLSLFFWKLIEANAVARVEFDPEAKNLTFRKTWGNTIIKKDSIIWWRIIHASSATYYASGRPIALFEAQLNNDKHFYYPLKSFTYTSTSLKNLENFFESNLGIPPKSMRHFSSSESFLDWRFNFWHFII